MVDTSWVYLLPQGQSYGRRHTTAGVYPKPQWCIGGDSFTPLPLSFECRSHELALECLETAKPIADAIFRLPSQTTEAVMELLNRLDEWAILCVKMNAQAEIFYAVTLGMDVGIFISREYATRSLLRAKQKNFRKCYSFQTFEGAYIGLLTHMVTRLDFLDEVTSELVASNSPSSSQVAVTRTPSVASWTPSSSSSSYFSRSPLNSPPDRFSSSRTTLTAIGSASRIAASVQPLRYTVTPTRSLSRPLHSATTDQATGHRTDRSGPPPPPYSRSVVSPSQANPRSQETSESLSLLNQPPIRPTTPGRSTEGGPETSVRDAPRDDDRSSPSNPSSPTSLFDLYVIEHEFSPRFASKIRSVYENSTNRNHTEFRDNLAAQGVRGMSPGLARFYYEILRTPIV